MTLFYAKTLSAYIIEFFIAATYKLHLVRNHEALRARMGALKGCSSSTSAPDRSEAFHHLGKLRVFKYKLTGGFCVFR